MKFKQWMMTLVGSCLLIGSAWADSNAVSELNSRLKALSSVSARFEQWTTDPSGARLQESSGTFEVKRPDLFRWEVKSPFAQLIIADGKAVRLYDPDLEQLVIQPLAEQLNLTPALLLSGRTDALAQNYRISHTRAEGLDHFLLAPKNPDSLFEKLRLSFTKGQVAEMMLVDALGSRTQIRFADVRQNLAIDASRFDLELPDGVDVIDERQ